MKRPNYRAVLEYDGLIWHRSQLEVIYTSSSFASCNTTFFLLAILGSPRGKLSVSLRPFILPPCNVERKMIDFAIRRNGVACLIEKVLIRDVPHA